MNPPKKRNQNNFMDPNLVRLKIKKITTLSTIPEVLHRLSSMTEDPDTSMTQLARAISSDQVLTARILKMVNSVFYGLPRRVTGMKQALVLLGINVIKSLVLTCSVFQSISRDKDFTFDKSRFWIHSLGCAQAAGLLAERLECEKPEEINIAGLLHDIGKIVMDEHLPNEYNKALKLVQENDCLIIEAESEALHLSHPQVARWLLRAWELPDKLVEPVSFHHNPDRSKSYYLETAIVHLADIICRAKGAGTGGDGKIPVLNRSAWKTLKLNEGDLEDIFSEFDVRMQSSLLTE
jgi:putative nucleotidyltransferase with HDIG domain